MSTNKPIDLGKVSEETKEMGLGPSDNGTTPFGLQNA